MASILQKLQNEKYNSVFLSTEALSGQFLSSLESRIFLPATFKKVNNVVLSGMGGSALGAHVLKVLDICRVPFSFFHGYIAPTFVNKNTLFIASSYSGSTEEVIASLSDAEKKGAKIIIISAGGKLEQIAKIKKYPFIKFDTTFNPSDQPRYGLGYSLGALLNILISLNLISYKKTEVKNIIKKIKPVSVLQAEKVAKELVGISPIFVASEFLVGNAHIAANQINETCKTNAVYHTLPELNHHLMEGLKRPAINKKYLKFIFLESELYSKKINLRYKITKDIVGQNGINSFTLKVLGKTKLEQIINLMSIMSLAGLILAIDYNESPTDIPFVNYFKTKLKKLS